MDTPLLDVYYWCWRGETQLWCTKNKGKTSEMTRGSCKSIAYNVLPRSQLRASYASWIGLIWYLGIVAYNIWTGLVLLFLWNQLYCKMLSCVLCIQHRGTSYYRPQAQKFKVMFATCYYNRWIAFNDTNSATEILFLRAKWRSDKDVKWSGLLNRKELSMESKPWLHPELMLSSLYW